MKAPVVEIFSSFQGEGLFVGRREIFIRLGGCNLDCSYCDTPTSQSVENVDLLSINEVLNEVNKLKTPDLHSISITGGEPTLYIDFIIELIDKIDFPILLETNGSIPEAIKKLNYKNGNLIVSIDIKLPEFFNKKNIHDIQIYKKEIESMKILMKNNIDFYFKIVISPETDFDVFEKILKEVNNEYKLSNKDILNNKILNKNILNKNIANKDILNKDMLNKNNDKLSIVIQPQSPMAIWKNNKKKFFKFSKIAGKYMDVYLIPQIHKFLEIE